MHERIRLVARSRVWRLGAMHDRLQAECRVAYIPGVVLFLEITASLGFRGRGFGLGWQFAAILGLLAHPGGHLVRQAGEHRATYVWRARESWMLYSFSLSSSHSLFQLNDVSLFRMAVESSRTVTKPSRDRNDDEYTESTRPSSRQRYHRLRSRT